MNPEAKDLINKLLVRDPRERLGAMKSGKNSIEALKKHKFFKKIDFNHIRKEVPPVRSNEIDVVKFLRKFEDVFVEQYEDECLEQLEDSTDEYNSARRVSFALPVSDIKNPSKAVDEKEKSIVKKKTKKNTKKMLKKSKMIKVTSNKLISDDE